MVHSKLCRSCLVPKKAALNAFIYFNAILSQVSIWIPVNVLLETKIRKSLL